MFANGDNKENQSHSPKSDRHNNRGHGPHYLDHKSPMTVPFDTTGLGFTKIDLAKLLYNIRLSLSFINFI